MVLTGYQLNIVSKEHLNALIYSGPEAEKHLYLYHHDNHYNVITSIPSFLARKQYCHRCKKGFYKITNHPCGDLCKLCNTQNCPLVECGNIAAIATVILKARNVSNALKTTTVQPKRYVVPW